MGSLIKNKSITLICIICALIINSFFVLAAQPSLPTIIYGKVINQDLTPAEGVSVSAKWFDSNGIEHTTTTTTLTSDESADQNLAGYFFFNQGYLQAREGSWIILEVGGTTKQIDTNPGGEGINVETITFSPKTAESKTPEKGISQKPVSDKVAPPGQWRKATPPGEFIPPTTPSFPTQVYGQLLDENKNPIAGEKVTAEWTDENGALQGTTTTTLTKEEAEELGDISLEGHYMFNKGNIKAEADSSITIKSEEGELEKSVKAKPGEKVNADLPDSDTSSLAEDLPTEIQGKVLDEDGKTVAGDDVTAEWIDKKGITHTTTTKTLTKEEAEELGDSSLEGYYMFSRGEIKAGTDTPIIVKSEKTRLEKSVKAKPGERVNVDLSYEGKEKKWLDSPLGRITLILLIIVLVVAVICWRNIRKKAKAKEEDSIIKEINRDVEKLDNIKVKDFMTVISRLNRDIKKLSNIKARDFMTRKVVTISEDKKVAKLVKKFLSKDVTSVVVVEGRTPVGIVTKRDLLKKISNINPHRTWVREIMRTPIETIEPDLKFSEAMDFSRENNMSDIPVTRNSRLIGIVTQKDLAKISLEIKFIKLIGKIFKKR